MAVDAWRWHQGGEALEQRPRRQAQRAAPVRTRLGAFAQQALGIELEQPVLDEGSRGAVP